MSAISSLKQKRIHFSWKVNWFKTSRRLTLFLILFHCFNFRNTHRDNTKKYVENLTIKKVNRFIVITRTTSIVIDTLQIWTFRGWLDNLLNRSFSLWVVALFWLKQFSKFDLLYWKVCSLTLCFFNFRNTSQQCEEISGKHHNGAD